MAYFDREAGRYVARVVYDGPPHAGKTTNLRELCRFFSTERRSELYTPAEREGRTLYFDWLQIECGFVDGRPLRCQLVSVPGQHELAMRRSRLLRDADAVVFVCESEADEVRRARAGFAMLCEFLGRAGRSRVPVIVQANKQDLPGALGPDAVLEALGAKGSPLVEGIVAACASTGDGVREAMVLAVKAISATLQTAPLLEGETTTAAGLLRELVEADSANASATGSDAAPLAPSGATTNAGRSPDDPRLPDGDVAVGCVWPVLGGREVLRRASAERTFARDMRLPLAGSTSDPARPRIFHAGRWRLATSARLQFSSLEEGRAALRSHAKRRQLLGALLAPESVLALQSGAAERWWLWTVSPQRATVQAELVRANARRDEAALGAALASFAFGAVQVAALAQWHRLDVDLHPSNFISQEQGAEPLCLDEFVENASIDTDLASALLQRIDEYARWPAAVERYLEAITIAIEQARGRGCDFEPQARQALSVPVHTDLTREARARLCRLLSRPSPVAVAT